jgi:hypothetical protein
MNSYKHSDIPNPRLTGQVCRYYEGHRPGPGVLIAGPYCHLSDRAFADPPLFAELHGPMPPPEPKRKPRPQPTQRETQLSLRL